MLLVITALWLLAQLVDIAVLVGLIGRVNHLEIQVCLLEHRPPSCHAG